MPDVKWIKISTDIFDDDAFQIIDSMPEADAIELIWFKLLVYAGKSNNNGLFLFKDSIAYTDEMLASIFHRSLNVVRLAMSTFVQLGMIEQIDDVYTIPKWQKHQNLDAYEAKKERDREYSKKYREKQKMLIEEKKNKKSSDESSDKSSDVSRFCSYSYSKSNNITNYDYLLNNDIQEDYIIYINNNNILNECIRDWLEHKQECNGKAKLIYTEKSLKILLKQIVNKDKEIGTNRVKGAIYDAISGNWQGIHWDSSKKPKSEMTMVEKEIQKTQEATDFMEYLNRNELGGEFNGIK